MGFVISRHARRRLQLYRIDEADVIAALEGCELRATVTGTRGVIVDEGFAGKYGFPIKIIFELERANVLVVTAYPLKRGTPK